ncbi:TPA: hypothetical protein ACS72F_000366 [Providencia alcalifaciens]
MDIHWGRWFEQYGIVVMISMKNSVGLHPDMNLMMQLANENHIA